MAGIALYIAGTAFGWITAVSESVPGGGGGNPTRWAAAVGGGGSARRCGRAAGGALLGGVRDPGGNGMAGEQRGKGMSSHSYLTGINVTMNRRGPD